MNRILLVVLLLLSGCSSVGPRTQGQQFEDAFFAILGVAAGVAAARGTQAGGYDNTSYNAPKAATGPRECIHDGDCLPSRCMKARQSDYKGICARPVDNYGMPDTSMSMQAIGRSCTYANDCGVGQSCAVPGGQMVGICVK